MRSTFYAELNMEMPTKSKNPEAATLFQASLSVAFTLVTSIVVGRNQIVEKHGDEPSPHIDASVFVSVP
jgi:hypothetical protein